MLCMEEECLLFSSIILKKELHLDLLLHCDSPCSDCGVKVFVWVLIFSVVASLMSIEREVFLNNLCFGREVAYLNFVFSGKLAVFCCFGRSQAC